MTSDEVDGGVPVARIVASHPIHPAAHSPSASTSGPKALLTFRPRASRTAKPVAPTDSPITITALTIARSITQYAAIRTAMTSHNTKRRIPELSVVPEPSMSGIGRELDEPHWTGIGGRVNAKEIARDYGSG